MSAQHGVEAKKACFDPFADLQAVAQPGGGAPGARAPPETFPMLMLKCLIYACARVFEDIFELTMILQIKSYLRTTMCPTRLNGFAQMTINRDLNINEKTVIDIFLRKKRRLSFIF